MLFQKIYDQKQLPQQRQISKISTIFKKGPPECEKLQTNLKIFEKLVLLKLQKSESLNKVDLTGKSQHGFKRKHSTASLTIQSLLPSALDDNNFAVMASLDLSSAFDVVNVELLIKWLGIIGIPEDFIF